MGTTNGLLLPYPELTETADGPDAFSRLANGVEDYFFDRILPSGVSRMPSYYWGAGNTFPTTGLVVGDTYRHTSLNALMEYTGAGQGWRQLEIPVVANSTAQGAIPTGLLYRGFQIYRTDLGYVMEYQTSNTGWTKPWSQAWGTQFVSTDPTMGGARGQTTQVGPNSNPYFNFWAPTNQPQNYYANRTYEITYDVFAYCAMTTARHGFVTFPQIVNDAGNTDYSGGIKTRQVLHGNIDRADFIDVTSMCHWNPAANYLGVYARLMNYTTYAPGSAIYWDTAARQFFAVKDMGPVGAAL